MGKSACTTQKDPAETPLQKIRMTCPFEECQRLITEAINRQKTTDAHNEATTNLTTAASIPLKSTTADDQLSNNQSDNSARKS